MTGFSDDYRLTEVENFKVGEVDSLPVPLPRTE